MTDFAIINTLDKLPPPSFITVKTTEEIKRKITSKWKILLNTSVYCQCYQSFKNEKDFLEGYIERKGVQLRLEKALLLTKKIFRLLQRWQNNDFYSNLKHYEMSYGISITKKKSQTPLRIPSYSWTIWIIYLAIREASILSKIKKDVEETIGGWLGMISSSHHWGDSLVVVGILSRIWNTSSKMTQDILNILYPSLKNISSLFDNGNKNDNFLDNFEFPKDLQQWLKIKMNMDFKPSLIRKEINFEIPKKTIEEVAEELINESTFLEANKSDVDVEDVSESEPTPKKKKKKKTTTGAKTEEINYWKKLFASYHTHLTNPKGKKILLKRLKKFIKEEKNKKFKVKMTKIKKLILKQEKDEVIEDCANEEIEKKSLLLLFSNFEKFIGKHLKNLNK